MAAAPTRLESATALLACLLVLVALTIIWGARLSIGRDVYVSVLGAPGMPTAAWFQAALVLVSSGGALVAFSVRGIRVTPPILRVWRPAVSLGWASGFFLIASQVTCTPGCPLPYGPLFTWPDFVHTTSAVVAFAFACWAMLQLTFAPGRHLIAGLSLFSGIAVAIIAATGGIMSLVGWERGIGSRFEFAATTLAIAWLVSLGLAVAVPRSPRPGWLRRRLPSRRPEPAPRPASSLGASGATAEQQTVDGPGLSAPR